MPFGREGQAGLLCCPHSEAIPCLQQGSTHLSSQGRKSRGKGEKGREGKWEEMRANNEQKQSAPAGLCSVAVPLQLSTLP